MADIPLSLLQNIILFLAIPFVFAYFFKKRNISPIVGYMLGGIVVGNFFSGLVTKETVSGFAYFGIILLMFTVGLEIQFDRMFSLRKYIMLAGFLQLVLSLVFIALISLFFGFTFTQALLIGIALSSSSTTIVAKIIQDNGEEGSFHGELAMGILMFQDLAFIPFMIIFNSLTTEHQTIGEMAGRVVLDMVFATFILAFAYYVGRRVAPYLFDKFARVSRELLNIFMIVAIFVIAYVSILLHISVFIAIFVAGIVVSQTSEHYHIFSQIRPFRDILAVIFFIFIGTNVNLGVLFPSLGSVLLFALLVMLAKALIIFLLFLSFRFHSKLSIYLSLFLFQIDEDAFILMSVAYANKIFTEQQYMFVVATVLISLLLTPSLIMNKEKVYKKLWAFVHRFLPFFHSFVTKRIDRDRSSIDALSIANHVILCGYGRIGSYIGRALLLAHIPFVAIDYNFQTVEKARQEGINIIYGDPTDIDMLDYAEAEHATAIVLALPDRFSQETIIMNAKQLNHNIIIMSRIHRNKDGKRMKNLGVHVVIQPEFEASLSIIKKIMLLKKVDHAEILRQIAYIKKEHEGI